MAMYSRKLGRETPFCLVPADWHKDAWLIRALLAHPAGGERKVEAVAEVLRGDASYEKVAWRLNISTATLLEWEDALLQVVRRDLWRAFQVQRKAAKERQGRHPFTDYYGA